MLAVWLGTFHQRGIFIFLPLCLGDDCKLRLSSSQNFSVLLVLPLLPAWLLASQCPIKLIRVTNLRSVQEHCPMAAELT